MVAGPGGRRTRARPCRTHIVSWSRSGCKQNDRVGSTRTRRTMTTMTLDDVRALVGHGKVEFFLCSFVELTGAPKAKVVPASHLDEMATEGAGFAGFAAGDIGQLPHHPDMFAIPDFRSTTVLPWRPNVAWVAGNVHVGGRSSPFCPRTILSCYLDKVRREHGY